MRASVFPQASGLGNNRISFELALHEGSERLGRIRAARIKAELLHQPLGQFQIGADLYPASTPLGQLRGIKCASFGCS